MNSKLSKLIKELELEFRLIPKERKVALKSLGQTILHHLQNRDAARITVICTHNSRRSQLAQLWLSVAAHHYNIENIFVYSGGTEATAFNHRMVAAIARAGFEIIEIEKGENPKYNIPFTSTDELLDIYFSKKYDAIYNPQKNFIAILVCDTAAAACPIVHGASDRINLLYKDPKAYDDTDLETQKYDEKIREIGREMLYCIGTIEK